ncbi:MAG TPA: hypothetical protein VF177_20185 [Anaerolineae bacterium]
MKSLLRLILLGAGAGAVGGVVQPAVGKLEEMLGFPPGENSNVPRHFVEALANRAGVNLPNTTSWWAGVGFHVGYALFWGAAYAMVREQKEFPPVLGGLGLGAVLYTVAFSRLGAGVQAGSEPAPDKRPPHKWAHTLTMPFAYSLTTAAVYERIRNVRL